MSAVGRRGAPEPCGPSKNQDLNGRLLARSRHPVSTSTWPTDRSRSARHAHRRPIYVSFVSKAILWDRGLYRYTAHDRPSHRPSLCPRFLSHMKARPEDLRPPCFLSSKSRLQPPFQGKTANPHTLAAPKTQTLEGFFHLNPHRRRNLVQNQGSITGRSSAVVVPCLPLPSATPPSSTVNPTPRHQNIRHPDSVGQRSQPKSVPASPSDPHPAPEDKDEVQDTEPQSAEASITVSDRKMHPGPAGPQRSPSPASLVSHGSLSDLSRPPSSLFSRSTDLNSGRISVLSDIRDSDPEERASFSPFLPRLEMQSPLASDPPAGSHPPRSSTDTITTPALYEPLFGPTKPLSPRLTSGVFSQSDKTQSRCETAADNRHQDAFIDPDLKPSLDSDHGLITLTFPSATWSSCPSPQRTTPLSGSGPKLTPSAPMTQPESLTSHRWPVLPPISPVRGRCGTAASRYSELSCSQTHVFDELEAIAPRSISCPSLDESSNSSSSISQDTELSPGLAALTVGCDSGNLGSLSRVRLLLLDRMEPETLPSPRGHEEGLSMVQDWSEDLELTSAGVSRPLTADGVPERCDSAGKVPEDESEPSEGGSGSPSSWIIDQSPSYDMFRSTCSPKSNHGSCTDDGDPAESSYPGWRDRVESDPDHSTKAKDRRRKEEREMKALNMLSKLQDDTPRQPNGSKGRSNFEDFDFLAKYCIFSPEKLVEYRRAFETEDSDGDGYISCLQVLLALKTIIPPELLSDEEEIYVYRILELVDFRVTDGLVDLRLFAVISSLAQKIAAMDDFMRSLISDMDFRSLEVRLFKAKQLFLFLLEEQRGDAGVQQGVISAEQLLLELKAGGIHLEQDAAVRVELQHIPHLDLLDFLAYLPLFMLIHKSVISNPLDDSSSL